MDIHPGYSGTTLPRTDPRHPPDSATSPTCSYTGTESSASPKQTPQSDSPFRIWALTILKFVIYKIHFPLHLNDNGTKYRSVLTLTQANLE
jgi:hypothetical protein